MLTKLLRELALRPDRLRLLEAHPARHPQISQDLLQPPDLLRRPVHPLELPRPLLPHAARHDERLFHAYTPGQLFALEGGGRGGDVP